MNIFLESLNILISIFCGFVDGCQGLSKTFHFSILLLAFYLLFENYLLILKFLTEILLVIPFPVIGRCSPVSTPHWLQGKCAKNTCRKVPLQVNFLDERNFALVSV
jgi:hypothetical protein